MNEESIAFQVSLGWKGPRGVTSGGALIGRAVAINKLSDALRSAVLEI
jgi:hypothetical protein